MQLKPNEQKVPASQHSVLLLLLLLLLLLAVGLGGSWSLRSMTAFFTSEFHFYSSLLLFDFRLFNKAG